MREVRISGLVMGKIADLERYLMDGFEIIRRSSFMPKCPNEGVCTGIESCCRSSLVSFQEMADEGLQMRCI